MSYYFYTPEMLPQGFKYPNSFVDYVSQLNVPYLEPWWFLGEFPDSANSWFSEIKKQYPSRVLVPFSKRGDTDDVCCFDGTDTTGNPKVYYVHTFASPGWEDRGFVQDFDEWLSVTIKHSEEWKKDQ